MVRYLQSRLNDLRDENLLLRERFKSASYLQPQTNQVNSSKAYTDDYQNMNGSTCSVIGSMKNDFNDDENVQPSLYTPSIDGDEQLESKNELLQQKLNELQKLQLQLNNVQS